MSAARNETTERTRRRISAGLRIPFGLGFLLFARSEQTGPPHYVALLSAYVAFAVVWLVWSELRLRPGAAEGRVWDHARLVLDLILVTMVVAATGVAYSFAVVGYVIITALSSLKKSEIPGRAAMLLSALLFTGLAALDWFYPEILNAAEYAGAAAGKARGLTYILAPAVLSLGCLLVNRAIRSLYVRSESARVRAEAESANAQLALVMAEKTRFELQAFSEFARMLNSSDSFDEIIGSIFDYVAENFHIEAMVLYLLDRSQNDLYLAQMRFPDSVPEELVDFLRKQRLSLDDEKSVHATVCRGGRPFYVPRLRKNLSTLDRRVSAAAGFRSILLVPLYIQDELFGLINFSNINRPLKLGKEEIKSIAMFCEQIAGAMKGARLLADAREARAAAERDRKHSERARAQLAELNQISRAVNATANLDEVLDHVFSYIQRVYDIEGIWLQFIDEENQELYTYKTTTPENIPREKLSFIRAHRVPLRPGGGVAYDVYRRRRHFYLPRKPRSFMYEGDRVLMETMNVESAVYVPLVIGEEVAGLIVFTRYGRPLELKRDSIEAIVTFCAQIAGAVNTSRMHAESELSRMMAEQTLEEVQALKNQQDIDYYLTSNLIEPLTGIGVKSETVAVEQVIRQKKRFPFKRWECEIGGDINMADSVRLGGMPYTAFINADAMGKSIQGAGGVLVLGATARLIIERTAKSRYQYPEQWLKNTYNELDLIFKKFEGSMYITLVIGLVDDATGFTYFINAEHPPPALFRAGKARYVQERQPVHKLGFLLGKRRFRVERLRLRSGDSLFVGSDGKDDVKLDDGQINTSEDFFLRHLKAGGGELHGVFRSIREEGRLTDDFSMLSVNYKNTFPEPPAGLEGEIALRLAERADELSARADHAGVLSLTEAPAARILSAAQSFGPRMDAIFENIILARVKAAAAVGDFRSALEAGRVYIIVNPDSTELIESLARVAEELGEYDFAADCGERVFLRDPDRLSNLLALIDTHMRIGNGGRAKFLLEAARDALNDEAEQSADWRDRVAELATRAGNMFGKS